MSAAPTPIVDAHLDLAHNALEGRDLRLEVAEIRAAEQRTREQCMVTLPEMRRGGVAVAFATVYAGPSGWAEDGSPVYETAPWARGREQLEVYRAWETAGLVRVITNAPALDAHLESWQRDRLPGLIFLMESADSIEHPRDLPEWWDAGIRVIGPAWSRTRYAGGTHRPGGLTDLGRELIQRMAEQGVALDASHLAEESFWQALELGNHALAASHSNARALVDTDRQLSDAMIEAIGAAGGVVGLNLYSRFLLPGWDGDEDRRPAVSLADVRRHAEQVAGLIGWERVGIGSDLDGGLGVEETPAELDTIADLGLLEAIAPADRRESLLGGNWLRWLRANLPRA